MQNDIFMYKTIVMSDVHLGARGSQAKAATKFLKTHDCRKLILNGDIIDGWQLKKSGNKWKKSHTDFFRVVLKKMSKSDTQVIYLRGNHDDFLESIGPMQIGRNFTICNEYIHHSVGKKYYVTHGDLFDGITSKFRFLAYMGDVGYNLLLGINRLYNSYRRWRGKPYYSISKIVKHKVKMAVNFMSDFEQKLAKLAIYKNCDGIICGHIHKPIIKNIGEVTYMNSGDWVESLSALVEDFEGNWKLIYFDQTLPDIDDDQENIDFDMQSFTKFETETHDLNLK